jgi:hypothetical protein
MMIARFCMLAIIFFLSIKVPRIILDDNPHDLLGGKLSVFLENYKLINN